MVKSKTFGTFYVWSEMVMFSSYLEACVGKALISISRFKLFHILKILISSSFAGSTTK